MLYFLLIWKVCWVLCKVVQCGVEVCLLLVGWFIDYVLVCYVGQCYYLCLLCVGVCIYEYQLCFLYLKMVMVDDWVSVGFCNFDYWNLCFNFDVNFEVFDLDFINEVVVSLLVDFVDSCEVILVMWCV